MTKRILKIIPKILLVLLIVTSIFSETRMYEMLSELYIGKFVIVVILGAFLFSMIVLQRQNRWIKSSIRGTSLAFVIWVFFMIISLFNAPYPVSGALLIISYVFLFLLAFILMPNYFKKESSYLTYNKLFWGSVLFSLMLSVALSIKDPASFDIFGNRFRYQAFFRNPNCLGAFSVLGIFTSIQMYAITHQKKYLVVIIPLLCMVYFSDSRASMIAIAVTLSMIVYLVFRERCKGTTRNLSGTTIFIALVILLVLGSIFVHSFTWDTMNKVTSLRLFYWTRAIKSLENFEWFFGQGLGRESIGSLSFDNYYFSTLIQIGLLGLLSFIMFLLSIVFFFGRQLNCKPHDKGLQISFIYLIAIMVYSMFEDTLFSLGNILSIYLWTNIGYQMAKGIRTMNTLHGGAILRGRNE